MRRRLTVLLLASLGALGALAPSASGDATPGGPASCIGLFASGVAPGGSLASDSGVAPGPDFGRAVSGVAHIHGGCPH